MLHIWASVAPPPCTVAELIYIECRFFPYYRSPLIVQAGYNISPSPHLHVRYMPALIARCSTDYNMLQDLACLQLPPPPPPAQGIALAFDIASPVHSKVKISPPPHRHCISCNTSLERVGTVLTEYDKNYKFL